MEQFRRRAEDEGRESAQVVLARIDERVKNLDKKLDDHQNSFDSHVAEDKASFQIIRDQIGKHAIFIYIAIGAVGVIKFLFK